MNKNDIICLLAKRTNLGISDCKNAVNSMLEIITQAVECGENVVLTGFGKFYAKYYDFDKIGNRYLAKNGDIVSRFVPKFKASESLKKRFLSVLVQK